MASEIRTPKPLRIGVLYEEVQMSDLVGLDIIGSLSVKTMGMVTSIIPEAAALQPLAVPMEFFYISSSLSPAWMSPEMFVRPTHTYESAPRDLDILFLGGPNPMAVSEESLVFIREAVKETKAVLSTCTGGMWLARSGVLDGRKATTNRILLASAKQNMPSVDWQDQRWVIENGHFEGAQIWTAGGAGCGIDMVVEYAKGVFDHRLVALSCAGLDFDLKGKGQFYTEPYASVI